MMNKLKIQILIVLIVSVLFSVNAYADNLGDRALKLYKTLSTEQKVMVYKSLNDIIEEEWGDFINKIYEREKRVNEILDSKYENGKLIINKRNYKLGNTSTPSTIAAFFRYLNSYYNDRYANDDFYYTESYEKTDLKFAEDFYGAINNILLKSNDVKACTKYFVERCADNKMDITETKTEDAIYINILYDTEPFKNYNYGKYAVKILGYNTLERGDLNYFYIYSLKNDEFVEYLLNENILK